MRGKRPSSIRKAEAETMVFANSVSSIMRNHDAMNNYYDSCLDRNLEAWKFVADSQRRNQEYVVAGLDYMGEDFLDETLRSTAALGDLQAGSIARMAKYYNKRYDGKDILKEQLPDKLHRPVIAMAMSNAVRTGKMEGKGFRGKRKPSRPSLFDVME